MHHRPHGAKPRASLNTSRIIYTLGYQQPAENIMKAVNKKRRDREKKKLAIQFGNVARMQQLAAGFAGSSAMLVGQRSRRCDVPGEHFNQLI